MVLNRHRAILLISAGAQGIFVLGGFNHMEDDDQDKIGEEIREGGSGTRERRRGQKTERQRTVRHMMTCG